MLQARYQMARCLTVPPGAFMPAPKVDSAVIRMVPLPVAAVRVRDWPIFAAVVALDAPDRGFPGVRAGVPERGPGM